VNFTPQRIGYHDDADAHDEDGENHRIVSFLDASSVVAAPGPPTYVLSLILFSVRYLKYFFAHWQS
jgi:hypothetical protein